MIGVAGLSPVIGAATFPPPSQTTNVLAAQVWEWSQEEGNAQVTTQPAADFLLIEVFQ